MTYAGEIQAGDIVVIRYEGPKGGPGMREMLNLTSAIIANIGTLAVRKGGLQHEYKNEHRKTI